jgi:hypothetical protein
VGGPRAPIPVGQTLIDGVTLVKCKFARIVVISAAAAQGSAYDAVTVIERLLTESDITPNSSRIERNFRQGTRVAWTA